LKRKNNLNGFGERDIRAHPAAHNTPIEYEIDARVAQLYGLTEEEYSLILSEMDTPERFRTVALNAYRDLA
jgi:hypothetical protein